MSIVITTLAVAFVALCVWLTVRLVNRDWRPGRRFWIAAPLVTMLAYPVSLFPLSWLQMRNVFGNIPFADSAIASYRVPAYWLADNGPEWFEYTVDFLETSAVPLD